MSVANPTADREPSHHAGNALPAIYAGLALTALAVVAIHLDHLTTNLLASHIRDGYPTYRAEQIDTASTTYLIYLTVLGVFGVVGWLVTALIVRRQRSAGRWLAAGLFVVGSSIALFNLTIRDTSGDTGLPVLIGVLGLLPSVAGLIVVIQLWRRHR